MDNQTQRSPRQRLFQQLSRIPGQHPPLDEELHLFLQTLTRNLATRQACLALRQEAELPLEPKALLRFPHEEAIALLRAIESNAGAQEKPFALSELGGRPLTSRDNGEASKNRIQYMVAPVPVAGRIMAVLAVDRCYSRREPLARDLELLELLAQVLARVLLLADQHKALRAFLGHCASQAEQEDAAHLVMSGLVAARNDGIFSLPALEGILPTDAKPSPGHGRPSLKEVERHEVLAALERNNWIQSRAARELGISLRQMGYKVRNFGLYSLLKERRRKQRDQAPRA